MEDLIEKMLQLKEEVKFKQYKDIVFKDVEHVSGQESSNGKYWGNFEGYLPLMFIRAVVGSIEDKDARKFWLLSDGMGEHVSPEVHEWDWSAIRDSSQEAIARMLALAKEYASYDDFVKMLKATEKKGM